MYHFGYGSNLSTAYTLDMLPNAKFFMKAYLPNYSVQFQFWSELRQGGLSNISVDPGQMVHGVLFEVPEKEMILLDDMDGVYKGQYFRKTFLILGEDGKTYPADLYKVIDPLGPFTPSKGYVEIMLNGAKEQNLDPEYIKKIQAFYDQGQ